MTMSEWRGPWKCEKCGKILFAPLLERHYRTERESGGSGETGWARYLSVECDGKLMPHDRREPDPRAAALVEAIEAAIKAVADVESRLFRASDLHDNMEHWLRMGDMQTTLREQVHEPLSAALRGAKQAGLPYDHE